MATFKCRGVNVEFPFEPYECQKNYMSKVIECLQTSQNGILESPTGTGKTVSLLCSTLAWRRAYVATQELRKCIRDDGANPDGGEGQGGGFRQELSKELKEGATGSGWGEVQEGNFVDRPRIIYASRTHSQLSQAVDQLKDTAYRPRVSIIGSREQLCIHPEVLQQESNTAKVHMCRAKVDNRMCHFHNNLEQKKGDKAFSEGILDIEELVRLGTQHKVCPYYIAKELKTSADIVFMPYNYLLDSKSRRIHGVELSGNVVIFDEAHNVEKICEDSASFELSSGDLASCINETDKLLSKTVSVEELNKEFRDDNAAEGDFNSRELAEMKMIFLDLERLVSAIDIPAIGSGVTKPGGFIFELFGRAKVTHDKRTDIMSLLDKMISHLTSNSESAGFHNKAAGLQKFLDVMNIMYSRDMEPMSGHNQAYQMSQCYKVHIRGGDQKKKKERTDLWTSKAASSNQKKAFVLSYWCFSPGFSMQELVSQGVRSIILTSGTLAPLSSFKSELRIDFPIQLENPHVIENHQMQVGIITRGPDSTVLNSSYQTRFNRDYINSLGNAIGSSLQGGEIETAKRTRSNLDDVDNLSESSMEEEDEESDESQQRMFIRQQPTNKKRKIGDAIISAPESLRTIAAQESPAPPPRQEEPDDEASLFVNFARIVPNGLLVFFPSYPVMNHCLEIWQENGVSNRISQYKQMFVEPRGKVDFVEAMEGFYEKVKDPTLNGASFFAVCRGKVSEGLDFADINGRAVVITGLPFPPRMDPKVTLKMQYLDEMRRKNNKYLSGQDWYRQQASRAVNQAIGRVIRHKEDYGAILLCDTRFTSSDSKSQLPMWLRPYVNEYSKFGLAVRDLTIFFKEAEKRMPAPKAKKARSTVTIKYETETGDSHMPGPSSRQPAMKARELDSHVRSLKRNRDGSHVSEDQLKTMYEDARPKTSMKGTGLLDALNHAEGSRPGGSGFMFEDALREQTNLQKNSDEPRKRKRIVIKERGFDSVEKDDKKAGASISSDVSIPAKKKRTGGTVLSAQAYIAEVKRMMSNEAYTEFSGLIRDYKKTTDLNLLVKHLADLFVDEPEKHYLFRNFYLFVRPKHKEEFNNICLCLTGKDCGFKPEHAIPRKKLEKHKESAAAESSKAESTVTSSSKYKDGDATKSTTSETITNLNTDSHLNQGQAKKQVDNDEDNQEAMQNKLCNGEDNDSGVREHLEIKSEEEKKLSSSACHYECAMDSDGHVTRGRADKSAEDDNSGTLDAFHDGITGLLRQKCDARESASESNKERESRVGYDPNVPEYDSKDRNQDDDCDMPSRQLQEGDSVSSAKSGSSRKHDRISERSNTYRNSNPQENYQYCEKKEMEQSSSIKQITSPPKSQVKGHVKKKQTSIMSMFKTDSKMSASQSCHKDNSSHKKTEKRDITGENTSSTPGKPKNSQSNSSSSHRKTEKRDNTKMKSSRSTPGKEKSKSSSSSSHRKTMKKDTQGRNMSASPDNQKGNRTSSSSSSHRKQKVFRKVMIPETPDKDNISRQETPDKNDVCRLESLAKDEDRRVHEDGPSRDRKEHRKTVRRDNTEITKGSTSGKHKSKSSSSSHRKSVKRDTQERNMTATTDNQKGNRTSSSSSSQRKQKVFRKVMIPETPDKDKDSELETQNKNDVRKRETPDKYDGRRVDGPSRESKENGSQDANSSLMSVSSSDMEMEGYEDLISASIQKIITPKREDVETQGGSKVKKKDAKSRKKLHLDGEEDDGVAIKRRNFNEEDGAAKKRRNFNDDSAEEDCTVKHKPPTDVKKDHVKHKHKEHKSSGKQYREGDKHRDINRTLSKNSKSKSRESGHHSKERVRSDSTKTASDHRQRKEKLSKDRGSVHHGKETQSTKKRSSDHERWREKSSENNRKPHSSGLKSPRTSEPDNWVSLKVKGSKQRSRQLSSDDDDNDDDFWDKAGFS